MTPAQEAKEYAAANGFIIEPDGRRYDIWIVGVKSIANVGSYPAALNAMRKFVDEAKDAESIKWMKDSGLADELVEPFMPENHSISIETPDGRVTSLTFQPGSSVSEPVDVNIKAGETFYIGVDNKPAHVLELDTPSKFDNLALPVEDFNEQSKKRIRAAAQSMQAPRKPWHLTADGFTVGDYGCRADAVKASRRFANAARQYGCAHTTAIRYVGV